MTYSRKVLDAAWFQRDTTAIARELLGMSLIFQREGDEALISGRITETEAYCGPEDKACHASRGRTARTEVMFGPAAHWYVYLIYGMYHCLNVVTGPLDYPAAVLIRGVDQVRGLEQDEKTDGPGKLCRAYGIDRALNGMPALGREASLRIVPGPGLSSKEDIVATPRIGIPYAEDYKEKPWRFCLQQRTD